MSAKLLHMASIGLLCQLACAAEQVPEPRWVMDANGCKFLNPASHDSSFTISWTGQCVDGFVSGPGEVRAGSWFAYRGEFSQGRIVNGTAEMNGSFYEGPFLDNLPNGPGMTRSTEGLVTMGTYQRGRLDPTMVEYTWPSRSRYRGQIHPQTLAMHGKGVMEYGDGSMYEGEFKENQREGAGVMKFPDGETHRGTFVGGRLEGQGSIVFANQARYEGELRAGEPSGPGRMEFADGTFCEGGFLAGKYHGKGKLKYASGAGYEGEFLAGERSGSGTLIYSDGVRYEGQFLYGRRHGAGRQTHPSGATYEGEWKGDQLTGKCRIAVEQSIYDGQCLDSKASGTGYLEDKEKRLVYRGEFAKDQFHGKGSLQAGELAYEGAFKAGAIDGPGVLTLGKLVMRGEFKSGVMVRGTIAADDGRTFEIDLEKDEVLEVLDDGSKRPVDELPADITI